MSGSAYYKGLADSLEVFKTQVVELSGTAQGLLDSITSAKPYISELIISHDTIDKGKLDTLSSTLDACIAAINAVVVECQILIDQYMELYHIALQMENQRYYARKKQGLLLGVDIQVN